MGASLGQRIAYFRKKAGLSQKKCAELAGIKPSAISYYESDKREPNVLILLKIAKVLNITVDALVGFEPQPDLIAQNSDEAHVLRVFRTLNSLGQDRVAEYAAVLSKSPQYAVVSGR